MSRKKKKGFNKTTDLGENIRPQQITIYAGKEQKEFWDKCMDNYLKSQKIDYDGY